MRFSKVVPFLLAATLFTVLPVSAQSASRNRIVAPINAGAETQLSGNLPPRARKEFDRGAVAPSFAMTHMLLSLKPTDEQEANLEKLLADQQNPSSPKFHKWLTPEQFANQFGVSQSDFDKTVAWLQSNGFKVTEKARSRRWVAFDGTAAQAAAVFHTQIHQYLVNNKLRYSNSSAPSVPTALSAVVAGVRLHNFRPQAHASVRKIKPNFTSDQSGNHFLVPDDFATIYGLHGLYNAGIDGTGQKIAVMGQTSIQMSNVTTFRSLSGLPVNTPTVILNGPDPGIVSGDDTEAYLDLQWAGAVAPKAQIIYVNSGGTASGAFDALKYAIDNNTAPVISISYGDCEPNFTSTDINTIKGWLQQANAQGQTVIGPSGDDGAADCDYPATASQSVITATHGLAVDVPASFPYVTAVGGTTFDEGTGSYWSTTNNSKNGSALSYIPEVSWNDTLADIANGGTSFAATGGGVSILFNQPTWQTGTGLNSTMRTVPDIAFAASVDHDGYLTCTPGYCVSPNGYRDSANTYLSVVGGTSAGVPAFAGMVALINQKTGQSQGNLNPVLYQLASTNPSVFHDITTGDNKVPCASGTPDCPSGGGTLGYSAGVGYDLNTGLGSVDGSALVNSWPGNYPDFKFSGTSSSLTLTHGTSGTQTLTFTPVNGYSGTLNLTCFVSSSLKGTSCSVPASVASNGTATVTINAASSLASLPRQSPFGWRINASLAMFAGMVTVAGRSSKKRAAILGTLLIICLALLMVGCGGGSSSSGGGGGSQTTSLTGDVIVTATDGNLTHSVSFNLTVN